MAFPSNPSDGQSYTLGSKLYVYSAARSAWEIQRNTVEDAQVINNYITNITENIVPAANEVQSIGTAEKRFSELYLSSNTIYLGDTQLSAADVLPFDLIVESETLTMAVDSPVAGHGGDWLWSWDAGAVAYSRLKIDQIVQSSIPLYNTSTYTVFNFAAHELHGSMTQTHKIHLKWIEGAGSDNLVPWSTETLNVTGVTFAGVNGGNSTEVQRLVINVPETITPPTLTPPAVTYNVSFANAGAYMFMGTAHGDNPTLGPVYRGGTYTFNVDATGHPFYLTTDDGTNYVSGDYVGEYTSGVTGSRTESGTITFVVPNDAPDTLYYQCGIHEPMRGTINIKDLAVETNDAGNYVLYFQHDQEGHTTPVEIRPKPGITDKHCLVYDGIEQKFRPTDMGLYLEETAQFQTKIENIVDTKTANLTFATQNDIDTSISNAVEYNITLAQQGVLAVTTGTARWYAPFGLTVTDIRPRLGTASVGADISININVDGSTTKTVTIPAGSTSVTVNAPSFTMNEGQYLTVDITGVGSDTAGSDLFLQFTYTKN